MGFGWGSAIGAVGDIFSGIGQRQDAKEFSKQDTARRAAALGELTPEAMQKLISMFFSKYYAQLAPQMGGAMSNLDARFSRAGLLHSGVGEQLRAGIPGQFANNALTNAIGSSIPIASQRANIQAGRQIAIGPSWWDTAGKVFTDVGNSMTPGGSFGSGGKSGGGMGGFM